MMNCNTIRSRLGEYIDGELEPTERRDIEEHLSGCEGCREELRKLHAIVDRAAALRYDLPPTRDLWPDVARDIAARRRARRPLSLLPGFSRPAVPSRRMSVTLVVSACLVLAVGIWIGVHRSPDPRSDRVVEGIVDTARPPVESAQSFEEQSVYLRVRRQLETTFERHKENLSPKTMRVIEKNLKVIDDALEEINQALEDDPGNPNLKLMLVATRKQAVDLLEQATKLPTQL